MSGPGRKRRAGLRGKTNGAAPRPQGQSAIGGKKAGTSGATLLASLIIVVAVSVLAAHWPALSAQAQSFDDRFYLGQNPLVQNPSWASAARFLGEVLEPSTIGGYYHPLPMISLMLDYAMGGRPDNLRSFHRTSLGLHVINTSLVIVLVYLLFGNPWAAAMVGLLFGVHPMTVEPVVWTGERKTVLAAFFALGSLNLYVAYAGKGGWKRYLGCLAVYVLALLSKPTATLLPVLLLLLDYWPLRRLSRRSLMEKLPFFAVAAVSIVITLISHSRTATVDLPGGQSLERIGLMTCHLITFYLGKIVWPTNLSSVYPPPEPLTLANPTVVVGVVGTALLLAGLLISWPRTPALLVGWLFFFAAILPTLGFVGYSWVVASDKYVYLPMVGLMISAAWLLGRWWEGVSRTRGPALGRAAPLALVAALAVLGSMGTRSYLVHWRDSDGLTRYLLSRAPRSPHVHYDMGNSLRSKGRFEEAVAEYRAALQYKPDHAWAHCNLGVALKAQGHLEEAVEHFKKALRIDSGLAAAHNNLAIALVEQGRIDEAIERYRAVLRIQPDFAEVYNNLGAALARQGRTGEAIKNYRRALSLVPDFARAHFNLGLALWSGGETDSAIKHFTEAVRCDPEYAEARNNLGGLLLPAGRVEEAVAHLTEAVRLAPGYVDARYNLGLALMRQGRIEAAIKQYEEVLRLDPSNIKAQRELQAASARMAREKEKRNE